jgi:dUTP pyrophosphatase
MMDIVLLPHAFRAPVYATVGSAGMDLYAANDADVLIEPGGMAVLPTGISVALPAGHEGQVRSRSGLAAKHMVAVLNSPGTVDEDYRGEVKVILVNHGPAAFRVTRGMRVAQMVVAKYARVDMRVVDALDGDTARGAGGFGSTGMMG